MSNEQFNAIHADLMTRKYAFAKIEANGQTMTVKAWAGGAYKRIYVVAENGKSIGYFAADWSWNHGHAQFSPSRTFGMADVTIDALYAEIFPAPVVVEIVEIPATPEIAPVGTRNGASAETTLTEGVTFTLDGKPAIVRNGAIFMALHPQADESERGTGNLALGWKIIHAYNSVVEYVEKGFSAESPALGVYEREIFKRIQIGLPVGVSAPDHKAWSDFFHEVYANS